MATEVRDVGDQEQLEVTFTNVSGNNADPSTVTLKIREPDGTITTWVNTDSPAPFTNPSTGVWRKDHTYTQEGRHFIEWSGSGDLIAAVASDRWVRRSNVA